MHGRGRQGGQPEASGRVCNDLRSRKRNWVIMIIIMIIVITHMIIMIIIMIILMKIMIIS